MYESPETERFTKLANSEILIFFSKNSPNDNTHPNKSIVQIRLHNFNVCINLFTPNDDHNTKPSNSHRTDTQTHERRQRKNLFICIFCVNRIETDRATERQVGIHAFLHVLSVVVEHFHCVLFMPIHSGVCRCSCVTCLFFRTILTLLQMQPSHTMKGVCVSGFVCLCVNVNSILVWMRYHAHIRSVRILPQANHKQRSRCGLHTTMTTIYTLISLCFFFSLNSSAVSSAV